MSIATSVLEDNLIAEELFDDFLSTLDEESFTEKQIIFRNAMQRTFNKLDYILKNMRASHRKAINQKFSSKPYTGLDRDFVGQTEVHAESFYCEAHRLKKLLHASGYYGFRKAKFISVTFIRNHIVEHPVVDKSVSSWISTDGPRLFVGTSATNNPKLRIFDRGFYPNAIEFYAELVDTLIKEIGRV